MTEWSSAESPQVDVARIMEELRARVAERKASGFYSEEEIRRISEMELELEEVLPGYRDDLDYHLAILNDSWDVKAGPAIASHRRLAGPAIMAAKKLLRRLTAPYISMILASQIEFNSTLVRLLNSFAPQVRDHLQGLGQQLEQQLEELDERQAASSLAFRGQIREMSLALEGVKQELLKQAGHLERIRGQDRLDLPKVELPSGTGELSEQEYLAFEDLHRGSREEIKQRQRVYLADFSLEPVLDVGCGRGEFLELLREAGVEARGIDLNRQMVRTCRERGLQVEQAEALAHLSRLPDDSLGGIFCSQMIEHLEPRALVALVQFAFAKLRPGGTFIAETLNPACLTIFSGAFYLDLTHIKPIHPQAVVFLLEAAGFGGVRVNYVNPYPKKMKLQTLEPAWAKRRFEEPLVEALNEIIRQLNDLLYGHQDYAAIGRKP